MPEELTMTMDWSVALFSWQLLFHMPYCMSAELVLQWLRLQTLHLYPVVHPGPYSHDFPPMPRALCQAAEAQTL